ncbi:MAG TPA: hypothetical protein DDZ76_11305 [Xanthomonadales bacterium]|nr:hypothetical protein [Xanthomonadales bacterium]
MRRPLHHFGFWRGLWWVAVLAVVVVSLVPPPPLPSAPGGDKLGHFLAYFVLMAAAVQLHGGRVLVAIAVALAALGLGLEFAQGALTSTRQFDLRDALANTLGVLAGLALAITPAAHSLVRLERCLRG